MCRLSQPNNCNKLAGFTLTPPTLSNISQSEADWHSLCGEQNSTRSSSGSPVLVPFRLRNSLHQRETLLPQSCCHNKRNHSVIIKNYGYKSLVFQLLPTSTKSASSSSSSPAPPAEAAPEQISPFHICSSTSKVTQRTTATTIRKLKALDQLVKLNKNNGYQRKLSRSAEAALSEFGSQQQTSTTTEILPHGQD